MCDFKFYLKYKKEWIISRAEQIKAFSDTNTIYDIIYTIHPTILMTLKKTPNH